MMKIYLLVVLLSATLCNVSGNFELKPEPDTEWCGGEAADDWDPCCKVIQCPFEPRIRQQGQFKKRFVTRSYPCSCYDQLKECRSNDDQYDSSSWREDGNVPDYWPFSNVKYMFTECLDVDHPKKCEIKHICLRLGAKNGKLDTFKVVRP